MLGGRWARTRVAHAPGSTTRSSPALVLSSNPPPIRSPVYEFIQPKMATACGGGDRYGTWRIYTGALFRTAGSNTDPSRLPTGARRCRR